MLALCLFVIIGLSSLILLITKEIPTMHFEIVSMSSTPDDPEAIEVDSGTSGPDIQWELSERYQVPCTLRYFGDHDSPLWPSLGERYGYLSVVRVNGETA